MTSPHTKKSSQTGDGIPISVPDYTGQFYFDKLNNSLYASDGRTDSSNWKPVEDLISSGTGLRKVINYTVPSPQLWTPNTFYNIDDEVIPLTGYTRFKYVCITSGTSSSLEPVWNTVNNGNTNDGTVVWKTEIDGIDEITFSGLDINSNEMYVINLELINRYASSTYDSWVNMFVNGDTNKSNYKYREGNTNGIGAYIAHSAYGEDCFAIINLKKMLNNHSVATSSTQNYRIEIRPIGWWHVNNLDMNITSLTLSADSVGFNVMGAGSRILIYGSK